MTLFDIFCSSLILIGVFFTLTGCVGIYKFHDIYTRLHAASKGTTFGFAFIVIGAALILGQPTDIAKALLAVIFQFITAPIAGHMIARVAIQKGLKPIESPTEEEKTVDAIPRLETD